MTTKEITVTIPDEDIVVTRKVPMSENTCTELRTIRGSREAQVSRDLGCKVHLPYPVVIADLINAEFARIMEE